MMDEILLLEGSACSRWRHCESKQNDAYVFKKKNHFRRSSPL